jgi:hypothetical protein
MAISLLDLGDVLPNTQENERKWLTAVVTTPASRVIGSGHFAGPVDFLGKSLSFNPTAAILKQVQRPKTLSCATTAPSEFAF